MVPLKAIYVGLKWELSLDLIFVAILIVLMWVFLHRVKMPASWPYIVVYAASVACFCELVHFLTHSDATDPEDLADTVHLEELLPAFTVGCMIDFEHHEHERERAKERRQLYELENVKENGSKAEVAPKKMLEDRISPDTVKLCISAVFMVLVGFSMPPLFNDKHDTDDHRRLGSSSPKMPAGQIVGHVVACTILMNLGKLFPATCYRKEVNLRTRIAFAVGMMPRGEVCAGIIVNALALGIEGP